VSVATDVASVIDMAFEISPETEAIAGIVEGLAVSVEKSQVAQIIFGLGESFFTADVTAKLKALLTPDGAVDAQLQADTLEDLKFPRSTT
jgi:hypothetical protein